MGTSIIFVFILLYILAIYCIFLRKKMIRIAVDEYIDFDLEQHKFELISYQVLPSMSIGNFAKLYSTTFGYMFALTKLHDPLQIYLNLKVKNKFNEIRVITAKVSYGLFDGIHDIQYEPALL
ncbi:hypothetical protein [Sphingobacterium sp. UME9]|uniref:hypothetical protein n=1 Tax=Sphingobacterium sp. UME9 TaxID=1862316 RepID=UPI001603F738|nr:hypothetical protein [Sphingobacterium sp. UME9]